VEQFVAKGPGVGADGDEQEIGFAGNGGESKFAEFVEEAMTLGTVGFDRTTNMVVVIEGSKGSGLANAGDVERSAKLVHFGYERRVADAVADAEAGESVDFGESAKGEDVVVLAEEFTGTRKIGAGSVFVISLVENDENITRNFFEEGGKFVVAERRAGGIVGIGDIDDAGLRGNRRGDGVKIEGVITHRRLDEMAAGSANGNGEERKGTFAGDALEAGAEESAGGEVDYFARAEADEDFFEAHIVAGGEDFTETLAATIGIPVGFAQGAASSFHGLGGGAEGIFVGSEFDGVDLEVLFDFLDGLARDIGREALDVIRDEFFEGVGHEFSLCRGLVFV